MNPIEKLVNEHKNILKGISILESSSNKLESGEAISSDIFAGLIDFIRNYADKYHHAKEEDILFVSMEKAGFPVQAGPVGVMLAEHDEGRGYLQAMEKANLRYASGETAVINEIVENARGYIYLLRQHINKEDNILYPMAQNALGQSGIDAMVPKFDQVEKEKAGVEKKYLGLLEKLESELSVTY